MANWISISRIFITFLSLYFMMMGKTSGYITAAVLITLQFVLDGVDGYVARKLNEVSKLGSVLDIMSDRIAENAYWIIFAVLGWLPVAFPMVILTRTVIVDNLRAVAMENNCTAFGECSMQKEPINQFICCSKFMRILYAVVKAVGFVLIVISAIRTFDFDTSSNLYLAGVSFLSLALLLCVLRGLPVIFESKRFFVKEEVTNE